ncbi:MAG: hypothetical protein LBG49_01025 [Mycoplasmataceae bacterium]|jgi:hypothetical protein|nr:hypothetical protein [Mycoplasmataceae bacterium]
MKNNKEYKITKASYSRLIGATFECVIINKIVNKPPIWFQEFEKENDARWAKQEEFNKAQLEFNKEVKDFMKYVVDVFQRNSLK